MKVQLKTETTDLPDFHPAQAGRKWLSYFDLLAWSKFCEKADLRTIFRVYRQVLRELDERAKGWPKLARSWASDTFVFYTVDDSPDAFQTIEFVSRWFEAKMLSEELPLRGALACGDFYVDEHARMFFGSALVEAHNYGEKQNWIGFILTPSAERRARELGLLPSAYYCAWPVNFKGTPETVETLQAFKVNSVQLSPAGGDVLHALQRMADRVGDAHVKLKYTRAIEFVQNCSGV